MLVLQELVELAKHAHSFSLKASQSLGGTIFLPSHFHYFFEIS